MSRHQTIHTNSAPKPVGPYSQGVVCNGLLFSAGQVGIDPATAKMVEGDVRAQARQVMRNLDAILTAGGCNFADVVKTTIFLSTMDHFAAVNEIYSAHFESAPPARTTVAVAGLPLGALLEVEVIAQLP